MSENAESLGERLRAARGRKALSAQKAADELHLDGWVIEGLESGNYERIGPPVYAKGHLKRYAELLGLPVADVLAEFDGTPVAIPSPAQSGGVRMRTSGPAGNGPPWLAIFGFAVVVLVVAGVIWLRPWHPRTPGAAVLASVGAAAPLDAASTATSEDRPPSAAASETGPSSGAAALPAGAAAAGGSAAVGAAAGTAGTLAAAGGAALAAGAVSSAADSKAASGRARLRLSFLADSWVDVHDASGQRLFAGKGHVNNVRSMSGEAPFRIYLKSASSIRMEINNHVVVIGPQFVVADAAHFEAGADGVLRRDPHAAPTQ